MIMHDVRRLTKDCPWHYEDALSEAFLGAVKALSTWQPDKSKFITYGGHAARNAALKYIQRESKRQLVEYVDLESKEDRTEGREEAIFRCAALERKVTRREYLCLFLRYGLDFSLDEVGFVIGVTGSRVSQIVEEAKCWIMAVIK